MRHELQRTIEDESQIQFATRWVEEMARRGLPGGPVRVSIGRPRRTLDQNSLMWALLTELSRKLEWHGQHLTPENWKDVLSAALKRQQVVPGVDGGFVVLGTSTRRMTKAEMSELIEFIYAFADDQGVELQEKAA